VTNHRDRTLDTLSHRINRAATIVPQVLEHLNEQRALVVALAANDPSSGSHGSGDHADPTLRAAMQLKLLDDKRETIRDAVQTLAVCVDMLDKDCRTALGMRGADPVIDATPQCTRDVQLPDETWVRCSRHVEHFTRPDGSIAFREGGACAMHRKREERSASHVSHETNSQAVA
jgi:hypothetical protein